MSEPAAAPTSRPHKGRLFCFCEVFYGNRPLLPRTSCRQLLLFRGSHIALGGPAAPGVYGLSLVVGILLMYTNGGTAKAFHFANHMTQLVEIMGVVNLLYAPVVAQLLFGDLYNSRMCNMLHAFPLRRENWFLTNILSGLTFSLVPTAAMCLVALPLLAGSIFEGTENHKVFMPSNGVLEALNSVRSRAGSDVFQQ